MREILFEGIRKDNNERVEGCYIKVTPYKEPNTGHRICTKDTWDMFEVEPDTVKQYTEIKDKNGVKIFDGNKVKFEATLIGEKDFEGTVEWLEGGWAIDNGTEAIRLWQECSPVEVIK